MANPPFLEIPGIILDIVQKNANEELVLRLVDYNGRRFLDLRVWAFKDGGLTPTRKGLTLKPEVWRRLLPRILSASDTTSNDQ